MSNILEPKLVRWGIAFVALTATLFVGGCSSSDKSAPIDEVAVSEALDTILLSSHETMNSGDASQFRTLLSSTYTPNTDRQLADFDPNALERIGSRFSTAGIKLNDISVHVSILDLAAGPNGTINVDFDAGVSYRAGPSTTSEAWRLKAVLEREDAKYLLQQLESRDASSQDSEVETTSNLVTPPPVPQLNVGQDVRAAVSGPFSCESAGSYLAPNAVAYLDEWATRHNPAFPSYKRSAGFGNDCTNFASQVLLAGGRMMLTGDSEDLSVWWYRKPIWLLGVFDRKHYSRTWAIARELFTNLVNYTQSQIIQSIIDLREGDLIFFDAANDTYDVGSGPDGAPEHATVVHTRECSGWSAACITLSYHTLDTAKKPLNVFLEEEKADWKTDKVGMWAIRPLFGCGTGNLTATGGSSSIGNSSGGTIGAVFGGAPNGGLSGATRGTATGGMVGTGGAAGIGGVFGTGGAGGPHCGNDLVETGEQCDRSALNGQTCLSVSGIYSGGTLSCSTNCTFVTSACTLITDACDGKDYPVNGVIDDIDGLEEPS